MPALLTRSARATKAHGERHGLTQLTTSRFAATLVEAWGLVALTCLLSHAQGAYCEHTEQGLVFFVFHREALTDESGPIAKRTLPSTASRKTGHGTAGLTELE